MRLCALVSRGREEQQQQQQQRRLLLSIEGESAVVPLTLAADEYKSYTTLIG